MAILRPMRFEPGTFLRPCDICGIRFRANTLVRGEDGFWRCMAYCVEVPTITRDKIIAESQRRREAPPPPWGIPFDRRNTYAEEALIFNFLCELPVRDATWPGGFRSGAPPASTVFVTDGGPGLATGLAALNSAATCRYLYGLITEAKRPTRWTTRATEKLRELADWLITKQVGFGDTPSATSSTSALYGAVRETTTTITQPATVAECGLAFIYAYRVFGDAAYLASAEAVANFLRNCQAVGSSAVNYTSSDAAGLNRLYLGAIPQQVSTAAAFLTNHRFSPTGIVAIEFWTALLGIVGDRTYGAPIAIAGSFTTVPTASLTQSIADCRAFWSVGAYDIVAGATVNGFSTTTPREVFNAYTNNTGSFPAGAGAWEFTNGNASVGTTISGATFAQALRSLFAIDGYSAQVASIWTWLMAFNSNPAFQCPAGTLATDYACASTTLAANPPTPPAGQGNVIPPSYDPTLALASLLLVRDSANGFASIAMNGSSIYDWSTTGYMAGIQSSQNQGAFKRAKDTLVTTRYRLPVTFASPEPIAENMALLRGRTGLAFQTDTASLIWSSLAAALVGNVFRYQPQSWTGTNPPTQQPGLRVA